MISSQSMLRFFLIVLLEAWFIFSCSSTSFNKTFYQAQTLQSQRKFQQALSKYILLTKKYPDHERIYQVHLEIGDIYGVIYQKNPIALQHYQIASEQRKDPDVARRAYEKIGEAYERDGDWVMMIDAYQKRLKYFPEVSGEDEIQLKIANGYLKLKDYQQAQLALTRWLERYPNSTLADQAHMKLGECCYGQNQLKEALRHYQIVLQRFPKSRFKWEAEYNAAFCLEEMGEWKEALHRYQKMKATYPNRSVIETKIKHLKDRIRRANRG